MLPLKHSQYVTQTFATEDAALQAIQDNLTSRGLPSYGLRPEEGRFLQCLVAACNAKTAVEIGTLGGYSGTWIGRGLAPGGRLITMEIDPRHIEVAKHTFEQAGLAEQVEIREGDAYRLLSDIESQGPFDFVFIDAVTQKYALFLEWALANTRPGSIIAAHNAFGYGSLFDPDPDSKGATIREFNQRFAAEPRLTSTIFPAGDGIVFGIVQSG
jgi:caffeoyl-CoA O-methyltransferase